MVLDDICVLIVDCPHSTAPDEGAGYPLIRTPNIGKARFLLDGVHRVSKQVYEQRNKRATPQDNDILFAREAPAGNAAIIKNGNKYCLGQRTVLIRPDPQKVDPDYLVYYLLAPEQQHKLMSTAHGATVSHVNIPDIHNMNVDNLPSIEIQQRIAAMLCAYDNLIESNQKQIKLLEEAAQRLYKEWFIDLRFPGHEITHVIDGVPEGWERKQLGELCTIQKRAVTPEAIEPHTPYIGLEHIPRKDFCLSSWGDASEISSNKYVFNKDDIIFGQIRPYFHKVGFAIVNGVASTDSFVMRPQENTWGLFLLTVSSEAFVNYSYQTCKEGAKMPRADWNQMKTYPVLVAENDIQRRFEEIISGIVQKVAALARQSKLLAEARDRLLPKLMSGDIEV